MADAGYSATPLARKLGIKPGQVAALIGAPPGWSVDDLPPGARLERHRDPRGAPVTVAFVRSAADLTRRVAALPPQIEPDAALWIAWPRRAAGHESDVTDELVRASLLPTGLVDVKVAALGEDWSGLRFVWRKDRRAPGR